LQRHHRRKNPEISGAQKSRRRRHHPDGGKFHKTFDQRGHWGVVWVELDEFLIIGKLKP